MGNKPTGFLQVDVDGLWAVRACYDRPEGKSFLHDPCWMDGVPSLAQLFSKHGLPAGFFIVGRDMELESKQTEAKALLKSGFELGNHSYTHTIGLTKKPIGFVYHEVQQTHAALVAVGARPIGFRSPGYDIDARILRVLRRMGYRYDASVLPTYLAPALRVADFFLARKWNKEKRQFGRFVYGRAPRRPYFPTVYAIRKPAPQGVNTGLLEIPVGTTPALRLPLTAASLLPLRRSHIRGMFERLAAKRRPVLLLLHAIDAVDCRQPIVFDDRRPRLGGFAMSQQRKLRKLETIVTEFGRVFDVTLARDYVKQTFEATP